MKSGPWEVTKGAAGVASNNGIDGIKGDGKGVQETAGVRSIEGDGNVKSNRGIAGIEGIKGIARLPVAKAKEEAILGNAGVACIKGVVGVAGVERGKGVEGNKGIAHEEWTLRNNGRRHRDLYSHDDRVLKVPSPKVVTPFFICHLFSWCLGAELVQHQSLTR